MQFAVNNITASSSSFYATQLPLTPIAAILIIAIGIAASVYFLSSLKRFKSIWRILELAGDFLVCAIIGAVTLAIIAVAYLALTVVADSAKGVDPVVYVYVVGGIILCAGVGFLVMVAFDRAISLYAQMRAKPKEEPATAQ